MQWALADLCIWETKKLFPTEEQAHRMRFSCTLTSEGQGTFRAGDTCLVTLRTHMMVTLGNDSLTHYTLNLITITTHMRGGGSFMRHTSKWLIMNYILLLSLDVHTQKGGKCSGGLLQRYLYWWSIEMWMDEHLQGLWNLWIGWNVLISFQKCPYCVG